jgi:hypothetical protein
MGLFDGIGNAETFERGKFFPPGFRGVVVVERTIAKESVKSGVGFIVECRVVDVTRAGEEGHEKSPVVVGEKRTWWQGMTDKTVAFPALKAWAAAMAGYTLDQTDEIENDVAPELERMMTEATNNPADNDLVGVSVNLETWNKKTKKGTDFTVHDWTPTT